MKTEKEWDRQHMCLAHSIVCNVSGKQYAISTNALFMSCPNCGPRPNDHANEIAKLTEEIGEWESRSHCHEEEAKWLRAEVSRLKIKCDGYEALEHVAQGLGYKNIASALEADNGIEGLRAEVARLTEELIAATDREEAAHEAGLKEAWRTARESCDAINGIANCPELDELKTEVARLKEKLLYYGHHANDCRRPLGPDCDCGWEEFERKLKRELLGTSRKK